MGGDTVLQSSGVWDTWWPQELRKENAKTQEHKLQKGTDNRNLQKVPHHGSQEPVAKVPFFEVPKVHQVPKVPF